MGSEVGSVTDDWRQTSIPGYFVDSAGRVRGPSGKVLKLKLTKGYPSFSRDKPSLVYVHTLVCEAFHGPRPSPIHQVAHWNGNRQDNRAVNLRWATPTENAADARRHGTFPLRPGGAAEANGNARLTWATVDALREDAASGLSQVRLARKYAISRAQVYNIVKRKQWVRPDEWQLSAPA
jgi:hypothetical protein